MDFNPEWTQICGQITEESRSTVETRAENQHFTQKGFSERTGISPRIARPLKPALKKSCESARVARLSCCVSPWENDVLACLQFERFNSWDAIAVKGFYAMSLAVE
jgi:hypothetical protein